MYISHNAIKTNLLTLLLSDRQREREDS